MPILHDDEELLGPKRHRLYRRQRSERSSSGEPPCPGNWPDGGSADEHRRRVGARLRPAARPVFIEAVIRE